jgi:hypothetical protein
MTKDAPKLKDAVSDIASALLDEGAEVTPDTVATAVLEQHARLVKAHVEQRDRKTVRSMAKSILKKRSDAPLQEELELGLPDVWVLRVRNENGEVSYALARDASEDALIGAESERKYAVTQAEAALANGTAAAERRLERTQTELERFRTLAGRLAGNGHAEP